VSVAAITAAGIIAPIAPQLGVSPVILALAIASGALFALQVDMTTVTSIASFVSLPLVMLAALVAPAVG